MEIKIALMRDALFHPKVWLFESAGDVMAAHGSSNVTYAGLQRTIEQTAISNSWEDPTQQHICTKLGYQFARLWDDKEDSCMVVSLPRAIKEQLVATYRSEVPPTEEELRALYRRAAGGASQFDETTAEVVPFPQRSFMIPCGLRHYQSPFA